ncbi:MAG: hypothetical protein L0Y72_01365 [Gemmataceae bacterium]|nr:hypothetical protein [Gemmataceae bacterium]MCI0737662.1 hypothetical protein [Gemmataceae bacterium]
MLKKILACLLMLGLVAGMGLGTVGCSKKAEEKKAEEKKADEKKADDKKKTP